MAFTAIKFMLQNKNSKNKSCK